MRQIAEAGGFRSVVASIVVMASSSLAFAAGGPTTNAPATSVKVPG